ncbi:MAG TPA: hypothetical protein VLC09_14970, partial [Polyangiaceae bacterium]|nr:hypothetical protein [Polyangiaceae bacterium]
MEVGFTREQLLPFVETGVVEGEECKKLCLEQQALECRLTFDPADLGFGADGQGGEGGYGGLPADGPVTAFPEPISGTCELLVPPTPPAGRRHANWGERAPVRAMGIGAWFARSAADEAGSVVSFRELSRELSRHGIDRVFRGRLARAARQEIAHARTMERWARRYGAERPVQRFEKRGERSLL